MKRRLLHNLSWLTFSSALTKPLWLIFIIVIVVRALGEEGYGVFTATISLAAIAGSLTDFGLTPYSIREVARRRQHASRFFSNLLVIKLALNVLAVGGAVVGGILLGYQGGKLLALVFAACYTTALSLTEYLRAYYQAFEEMRDVALSSLVEKVLVIALGLLFLLLYDTAAAVLGGMALGMLCTLIGNYWWATRRFASFAPALMSPTFLKQVLPAAFPLGLASQFVALYFRTDAVMVDAMVSEAAAGQYGEAYRLIEGVALVTGLLTTVVYPRLSSLYGDRQVSAFRQLFGLSVLGAGGIGLLLGMTLFFFAEPIVLLLTGSQTFIPAANALKILAWAAPFMALNYILSVSMNAADDHRWLAWVLGIAALFNLVFNFLVIPTYSFYGASVTTVMTEALITLALSVRCWRRLYTRSPAVP